MLRSSKVALGILAAAAAITSPAWAGDKVAKASQQANWAGFYVGSQIGAAVEKSTFADPFGASIYGDTVTSPGAISGITLGFNQQSGKFVYGLEADANWANLDGTNTCLAFSGFYVSANCHVKTDFVGSLTARLGAAVGDGGRTLIYGKGGLAVRRQSTDIENGNEYYGFIPDLVSANQSSNWGWTIGAGMEQALTPSISLKAEYDYMDFGSSTMSYPRSDFFDSVTDTPVAGGTTTVADKLQLFKLGINYKLGAGQTNFGQGFVASGHESHPKNAGGLQAEFGTRYWYSSGDFQWDNKDSVGTIQSRLTYSGLTAHSGEVFGRVDTPMNVFLKGQAGLGSVVGGTMNDEDWGIFGVISYSNTVSNEGNGKLTYATLDAGYDLFRGAGYKVGPFIGFNRYTQKTETRGCVQIANPLFPCLAPGDNTLVGTQDTTWDSVRVGTSAEVNLSDRLKLSADAAYLPYVWFNGRDDHLLRPTETYFTQSGSGGHGVQAEAVLSYDVTDHLNIGVGARYWSMWSDGTFTCTGCGGLGVTSDPPNPERISADRYGVLLQGAYKF